MSNLNFKEVQDLESRFEHLTGAETCPMWNVRLDLESTRN